MSRILCAADVADILRLDQSEVLDMVACREIPALTVCCGDALIGEAALWHLIDRSWYRPREES